MRPRALYTLLGVLLGLGAPLGSMALRVLLQGDLSWVDSIQHEWGTARFYYLYMAFGTTLAFGLFGYMLGQQNEKLGDLSVTDGLTRIFNHRHLQELLDREIERADRYATSITCLMMDIDDFKKVNDQYGHPFGDQVLFETAQLLKEAVRRTDWVGRYGGEEFLVIMPQTSTEAAFPFAERIVRSMQSHVFSFKGVLSAPITVSVGLATYPFPEHGVKSKSSLLSAVDQAMYQAKRAGKNQAKVWRP